MGTVFSIDVRAPGCTSGVVEQAIQWLHWADATFSTYQPDSHISRLSRGEIDIADCAPEVGEVLASCEVLRIKTGGYFSAYPSGHLDPSGFVKGWAIRHVSNMLLMAGSPNHCVNGGGDVDCAGAASDGQPWRIGIADPHDPGHVAAVVAGVDLAVATSGTAERGAHIINPHDTSTMPALSSVTIVGPDIALADAYATAAFAMGDDAASWIVGLDGYCGLIIRADGSRWASPNFPTVT
jgi:thiamine biosynthesis lipoprotein